VEGLSTQIVGLSNYPIPISTLSHLNLLDLSEVLMHHYFRGSFYDMATRGVR